MERPQAQYNNHWRRQQKARKLLRRQGFDVIAVAYSDAFCHLVATNTEQVRFVIVQTSQEIDAAALAKLRVPPNAYREIWRWRTLAREPEIEVLV